MTSQPPPIQNWTVRAVFRKNLKDLREELRNLTQQALAERLEELDWQGHMSSATIAKIEKGQRQVKIEEAIMIAQALRVGLVDLLYSPGHLIAIGRWLHPGITRQICGEAPWIEGIEWGRIPDESSPAPALYSFRQNSGGLHAVWDLVGDLRGIIDIWDVYGPSGRTPEFDRDVADEVDQIAELIAGHLNRWANSVRTEERHEEPR